MLAQDDVARLDVAMKDATAVRIVDGVADVDEPPQQLAQLQLTRADGLSGRRAGCMEPLDRRLERVAPYQAHGVEGPAIPVGPQAVDRDDTRVFQAAGDLRLELEPPAADRV